MIAASIPSAGQLYYEIRGNSYAPEYWANQYTRLNAVSDYYWTVSNQYCISAYDLQTYGVPAGNMTSISVLVRQSTPANTRNMTIYMDQRQGAPGIPYPWTRAGYDKVYDNGAWQVPLIGAQEQWVEFEFDEPYFWDGVSNVYIDFCSYRAGWAGTPVQLKHCLPNWGTSNRYIGTGYYWRDGGNYCDITHYSGRYWNRPIFRVGINTGITQSFPEDIDPRRVLERGVYDGSDADHPKPSLSFYGSVGQQVEMTYKIIGPLPSEDVVYTAVQNGSTTIRYTGVSNDEATVEMPDAQGIAAGVTGAFDASNLNGGTYRLDATWSIPGYVQDWRREFIVAYDNDAMVRLIRSPFRVPRKYPKGVPIPVSARIQNVGLNDLTDALVIATIEKEENGEEVYRDTVVFEGTLTTGELSTIDFKNFNPTDVRLWEVDVCIELQGAVDEQPSNDCASSTNTPHIFETLYNEEVSVNKVFAPTDDGEYYAQRPFRPIVVIENGGIMDLSDIPVRCEVFELPGRNRIFNELIVIPDVGAEVPANLATAQFPAFTPPNAGNYEVCMTTEYPGDPLEDNDQVCIEFTVNANLAGNYTIGTKYSGRANNFNTFEEATDALYLRGVSAPVTFEITDASYDVGPAEPDGPALDLRTTIIGVSATNTITFKPSLERSLSQGSIAIRLHSENGQGVVFGQAENASNPNAIQPVFAKDSKWNNSNGHITFDGGRQSSFRFQLDADSEFRAPFYLGDGSSNISIRNSVISNAPGTAASFATNLPSMFFINGQYTFEEDVRQAQGQVLTYSAGIVNRTKMPGLTAGNNEANLDTLTNDNNEFVGNKIENFGYGIVSLGIGQLLKGGVNKYTEYMNNGTMITGNTITNVRRAGVYLGFESAPLVSNNTIYNVGAATGSSMNAAGVMAGGVGRYQNQNVRVLNNDIHHISASMEASGILVDQQENTYLNLGGGSANAIESFAGGATFVGGNVVWGISRTDVDGSTAGIAIRTMRDGDHLTPDQPEFWTVGDSVVNNTIVMNDDNVAGTGAVVGVAFQNANAPVFVNNALAMQGAMNAAAYTHSAVLYQGTLFRNGKSNDWYLPEDAPGELVSNQNAFYTPNAGVARFIEISHNSELVSEGSQTEFEGIAQWRSWTGQDINSVVGDFMAEHVYNGIAPNQQLRVNINPQPPIGSILNDRGARITGLMFDLDGDLRGETGLGFDIGADEFEGLLYISDLESVEILSPGAYKSSAGQTSEAEYIMTTAPVDVTARVRNSGALPRTNAPVTVTIYRETKASNDGEFTLPVWETTPVVTSVRNVDLNSGVSSDVEFGIQDFAPQTYEQVGDYTVPARFETMALTVTPRYLIEVSVPNDEQLENNVKSKVVRFFIQRSQMSIVVSASNASATLNGGSSTNEIAGRLNSDSLQTAFSELGFVNEPQNDLIAYDVFDRSAWEPRAVDYSMYRTMFWSHDEMALTRTQRDDIRNFVAMGSPDQKRNLAISSQELVRQHTGQGIAEDANFVNMMLRAQAVGATTPAAPDYDGLRIIGRAIARNTLETVVSTGYANDNPPVPALMKLYSDGTTSGIALEGYNYVKGDRQTTDSIAGTATASLNNNTVYLGVDWRHYNRFGAYSGSERVLRGVIDFFEDNGGTVVPVELVSFDADARNNDVDVFWATASEQNADHFVVERALVDNAKAGETLAERSFSAVATVTATGNSTERKDYRIVDKGLNAGLYSYRLVSVDVDGSTARSHEVEVEVVDGTSVLSVQPVSPNPVKTTGRVGVQVPQQTRVSVTLVDVAGRTVAVLHDDVASKGLLSLVLDGSNLAAGRYTLVVATAGATVSTPVTIVR